MTTTSSKGAVYNDRMSLPAVDLDLLLSVIKQSVNDRLLGDTFTRPGGCRNALSVNFGPIIEACYASINERDGSVDMFGINEAKQVNTGGSDKTIFIGSRIKDPESPRAKELIVEIKQNLKQQLELLIDDPKSLFLYDAQVINFLSEQLNSSALNGKGEQLKQRVLKVAGKPLSADIRALIDHDHDPQIKPANNDLIVLQSVLTRHQREGMDLKEMMLSAYQRYLHDHKIQRILMDQLDLDDEDEEEQDDALAESIQIRLNVARKELDNPKSATRQFLSFIENDVESRLLLYISMGMMNDTSRSIQGMRHGDQFSVASHYLDSLKWFYEHYAHTPYTDQSDEVLRIPLASELGIPGLPEVRCSELLGLKYFFQGLPIVLKWESKLKDDNNSDSERVFVFKYRLNGIDPEMGIDTYTKCFEELKSLLIAAVNDGQAFTFKRQRLDLVLSRVCIMLAIALHHQQSGKHELKTVAGVVARKLVGNLLTQHPNWTALNPEARAQVIKTHIDKLANKYRHYYEQVADQIAGALKHQAIEFNPSLEDRVNMFISPELIDLDSHARSFIRDHSSEAFRWYQYVTLGRVDAQNQTVRKARKAPFETIEYSAQRMVKRLHQSKALASHPFTKTFYTGRGEGDKPRLLVHIGKLSKQGTSQYSQIKRNLFARRNGEALEVLSGIYLNPPELNLSYVTRRGQLTDTLDNASITKIEVFTSVFSILSLILMEALIEMIDSQSVGNALRAASRTLAGEADGSDESEPLEAVDPRELRPLISLLRIQEVGRDQSLNTDDVILSCSHALMHHLRRFTAVNMQGFVSSNILSSFSSESIYNSLLSNNEILFETSTPHPECTAQVAAISLSIRPGYQIGLEESDHYLALGEVFVSDSASGQVRLRNVGGFVDDYAAHADRKLYSMQQAIIDLHLKGYSHIAIIEGSYNRNRLNRTERSIDQISMELYRRLSNEYPTLRIYPMSCEKVMVLNESRSNASGFEIASLDLMDKMTQNLMTPAKGGREADAAKLNGALKPIYLFATLNAVGKRLHHRGLMTYQLNVPTTHDPHDPLVRNCYQLYDREGAPVYHSLVGAIRALHFAKSEKLPQGKTMKAAPVLEPLSDIQTERSVLQRGELTLHQSRSRRSVRFSVVALLQHINERLIMLRKDT